MTKTTADNIGHWSKVEKSDSASCWPWMASRHPKGYGHFGFRGKVTNAHRVSFFLATGKFSDMHILHKCDNPPCVNPDHLFEGSNYDNVRDKCRKGRAAGSSQTECLRGHPLSGPNLYIRKNGRRTCRACVASSQQRYYERKTKCNQH